MYTLFFFLILNLSESNVRLGLINVQKENTDAAASTLLDGKAVLNTAEGGMK
ncbi:MAG: hypothetical protein MUE81_15705 [Thermoflexibacter sp.]|jgi:hypothetical protein|nr:hypothetical protein [Thermoflexibacter sp.]